MWISWIRSDVVASGTTTATSHSSLIDPPPLPRRSTTDAFRARAARQANDSHLAFSVDAEGFASLSEAIRLSGARFWKENRSEGPSLYFEDPDGHKLEIHVGDQSYVLGAGDGFHLRSDLPHTLYNRGDEPAVLLWVTTHTPAGGASMT